MLFLRICIFSLLIFLCGCQSHGVVMYQQKISSSYLASTHVGSPDPRLENPPNGTMLVAEWWISKKTLEYDPVLRIEIIYRDFSTGCVEFPLSHKIGYETFSLLNEDFDKTGGILTYKAEIVTCDGEVYRQWKHQLWVELITVDEDEATDLTSSWVVEKSRHESVIETPVCNSLN